MYEHFTKMQSIVLGFYYNSFAKLNCNDFFCSNKSKCNEFVCEYDFKSKLNSAL